MRKKYDAKKHAISKVKGLTLEWVDVDPLGDREPKRPGRIGHKNPILRLMANDIYRTTAEWFLNRQRLRWLIEINVVFRYPNLDDFRGRELKGVGTLDEINEFVMPAIKEAMREGAEDKYLHTRLKMECLGHSAPLKFDDTEGHER